MTDATTIDISKLEVGDVFEAGPLMSILCPEKMIIQALRVHKGNPPHRADFEATYFGVRVGRPILIQNNGTSTWEWK